MITPSYLGETIEYSSLHACRSTLEDPTNELWVARDEKEERLSFVCRERPARRENEKINYFERIIDCPNIFETFSRLLCASARHRRLQSLRRGSGHNESRKRTRNTGLCAIFTSLLVAHHKISTCLHEAHLLFANSHPPSHHTRHVEIVFLSSRISFASVEGDVERSAFSGSTKDELADENLRTWISLFSRRFRF